MIILDLDMFDNATCGELPQSTKQAPASVDSSSAHLLTENLERDGKAVCSLPGRSIAEMTPKSVERTKGSRVAVESFAEFEKRYEAENSTSEMEQEFLGEDSVSNGDGPAVVPDSTDYTYHEEDEEDDASIHHGSDIISVADHQIDHPPSGASRSAPVDLEPSDRVLPAHLNDLLEQWYLRHGRIAPRCASVRSEFEMPKLWCFGNSRTPATWLHRSGVPLKVTWYPLPGTEEDNKKHGLKLIVVSGPGLPPSIVSYLNAGGSIAGIKEHGVVYRIWRGLSGNQDGFEPSPSVIKLNQGTIKPKPDRTIVRSSARARSQSYVPKQSASITRACDYCVMQHLSCDRRRPVCTRCASKGVNCYYRDDSLPKGGMQGPQVGAARSSNRIDLQRSDRVRKATTKYVPEELAPAKKRKVEHTSFDQDDDAESDVLLSEFMTSPQLVSTSTRTSLRASKSKPWACYLCDYNTTNKKEMRSHFREEHGLDPDENRLKWADSRVEVQKAQPVRTIHNTKGGRRSERTLETETTPDAEKVPLENHDADFGEYMKKNTKVMFFSRTQTPRVRLFSACDSVHKLFAQATAGEVFSREQGRVLAVEVEDQVGELPIVEDDEEDFGLFVERLKDASCWIIVNGQIEGETVVHIREKRK